MTVEEFKEIYPQFIDVNNKIIQNILDWFYALYSSINFGKFSDMAQGLYSAHILTVDLSMAIDKDNIENANISSGIISSEKTPEFSINYAMPDHVIKASYADAFFLRTEYGQRFLVLLKKITPCAMIV